MQKSQAMSSATQTPSRSKSVESFVTQAPLTPVASKSKSMEFVAQACSTPKSVEHDCSFDQIDHLEVEGPVCIKNAFYNRAVDCRTQKYCQTPEDVTNKWLSDALNASVLSHKKTLCGQGQLGLTVLVTDLQYAAGTKEMPNSVAIKMQTQTQATLPMVQLMNSYSRELFFYSHFSEELSLRCPKVLGIWTDANGADLQGEPVLGFNLMMENLCDEWDGFDPASNPPSLAELERTLLAIRPVHIKYWKHPIITEKPFSDFGKTYSMENYKPMMAMLPEAWPPVRSAFPGLAGWGTEFPSEFSGMVSFIDRFAADNALNMRLLDRCEKILQSRPMTLVHGDLNCGNVWKNKLDPEVLLFADWQLMQMAPAVTDLVSMLLMLPNGPSKEETMQLMRTYHSGLPVPMQEEYTLAQLHEDYLLLVMLSMTSIPLMLVGQLDPSSMPEEKYKYTWSQFWPSIFRPLAQQYHEEGLEEFASRLLHEE